MMGGSSGGSGDGIGSGGPPGSPGGTGSGTGGGSGSGGGLGTGGSGTRLLMCRATRALDPDTRRAPLFRKAGGEGPRGMTFLASTAHDRLLSEVPNPEPPPHPDPTDPPPTA